MSIRIRFSIYLALFLLIVMGAFYLYFSHHEEKALVEEMKLRGKAICSNLATSSVDAIVQESDLILQDLVERMKASNKGVVYAFITNNGDTILAHTDKDFINKIYLPPQGVSHLSTNENEKIQRYITQAGEDVFEIANAIILSGNRLGIAYIGLSYEGIKKVVMDARKKAMLISSGVILFGIVGVVIVVSFLVAPIRKLTSGIEIIGNGNLNYRIELKQKDEIGRIGDAVNIMAEKIKKSQEELIEKERMQREIAMAKEIQEALLPKEIPQVDGFDICSMYRSAKEVGGDYYDVFWVDKSAIGLVVADVSGKGVPGSMGMTMFRTTLRLLAMGDRNPKRVLSRVNSIISKDLKPGMFVTVFYVVLDIYKNTISIASAGHNPMFLCRSSNTGSGKLYALNPAGFPVGLRLPDDNLFENTIEVKSYELKKGDSFVLFTDGITEAMNNKNELFTEERFADIVSKNFNLSTEEFIKRVDEEISKFTMDAPQSDDITMLVVKVMKDKTLPPSEKAVQTATEQKIKPMVKVAEVTKQPDVKTQAPVLESAPQKIESVLSVRPEEDIQISIENAPNRDDINIIKIAGTLDTTTAPKLDITIKASLLDKKYKIIIDFGDVEYVSSAGWGVLVGDLKSIRNNNGDIRLAKLRPDIKDIFKLLEFARIFKAYETIEEAIQSFS